MGYNGYMAKTNAGQTRNSGQCEKEHNTFAQRNIVVKFITEH